MPYITPKDRAEIAEKPLGILRNAGELNYVITQACLRYLADGGLNYQTLNEIVGALECAKLEMYRRVASPYEDMRLAENGDVYPLCGS